MASIWNPRLMENLGWTDFTWPATTPDSCGVSASKIPSPARRWCFWPTIRACHRCPLPHFTNSVGKWIRQHLRIKRFLGIRENAVMRNFYPGTGKTQIWVAVSTYVLIAIVKKELHLQASLYTLRQILSVSVFEKTEILCALQPYTNRMIPSPPDNRLMLLDF